MISDLLDQNRKWSREQLAADPDFFRRLTLGQQPRLLVIGCSDSRVPMEQILRCGPGELFVHRNVANVVAYNDINIAAVIQYATGTLSVPDIVICGHYGCGGVKAACASELPDGYIGDWLMVTSRAKREVDQRLGDGKGRLDEESYLRLVVEENVRVQLEHLAHLSVTREAWRKTPGAPRLHGWAYDIATGLIQVLHDGSAL